VLVSVGDRPAFVCREVVENLNRIVPRQAVHVVMVEAVEGAVALGALLREWRPQSTPAIYMAGIVGLSGMRALAARLMCRWEIATRGYDSSVEPALAEDLDVMCRVDTGSLLHDITDTLAQARMRR
jgi:hypothetical protein